MQSAPDRADESASLQALQELQVLDTAPEAEFDALVRVASALCGMPIALISLIDADRQWFKAEVGLSGLTQTSRDISFCGHAVLGEDVFEVSDASLDGRFADNPLVTGHPYIRHYAGAPVCLSDGVRVGTICVIDPVPGQLDVTQRQALEYLATATARALEGRHAMWTALNTAAASGLIERAPGAVGPQVRTVVAELARQHERLHATLATSAESMTRDPLTGLPNRAAFERHLEIAWQGTTQPGVVHALLFIDLDRLRVINDACGHAAGDEVLRDAARLLSGVVRAADMVARIDGDEFAVILNRCSPDQALRVAQKICDRLDGYRFSHGQQRFRIGMSIGLVPVDRRWAGSAQIMQAAEASCFAATEAGGGRVHAWHERDQLLDTRHGEMQWVTRIGQALDEDRFVLFAQRIEAVGPPGRGVHAEVLIRMLDADGQLIPPGAFLPAAERFHLAARIDRWVLKRALAWLQSLPSLACIDTLSVNLSGQSLGDPSFQGWAMQTLADAGPALCKALCVEITETAAVSHMAVAAGFVAKVRALGVRVALDDFGMGASSFGYLKHFQIDYLKIDGHFIRDLLTDPLNDAAVRCFADVARVIGVKTVAEFVDQPTVLARLGEIGIDYAQGYLLHKPAALESLLAGEATLCAEPNPTHRSPRPPLKDLP